jgi:hypothetical protein
VAQIAILLQAGTCQFDGKTSTVRTAVTEVCSLSDVPKFGELINNVTASVGREATLACVVDDLATFKV